METTSTAQPIDGTVTLITTDPKALAAFLSLAVENETDRLNVSRGEENAPFGGWRNLAVYRVAERENMNPYALDHIIRSQDA